MYVVPLFYTLGLAKFADVVLYAIVECTTRAPGLRVAHCCAESLLYPAIFQTLMPCWLKTLRAWHIALRKLWTAPISRNSNVSLQQLIFHVPINASRTDGDRPNLFPVYDKWCTRGSKHHHLVLIVNEIFSNYPTGSFRRFVPPALMGSSSYRQTVK